MNRLLKALLLSTSVIAATTSYASAELKVVTSIKPVHSLVAAVMKGKGTPELIVKGASSPHDFVLKPSQANALQEADLVFWIGHELEKFLEKPVETIASAGVSVELLDSPGLVTFEFREDGAFEAHDHDDHASEDKHDDHDHDDHASEDKHDDHDHDDHASEDKHDDHDHDDHASEDKHDDHDDHASEDKHDDHDHDDHASEDKHDDHDHDDHASEDKHDDHDHDDHAESGHEGHDHGGVDPHIWLDPVNAKAMVHAIEKALNKADPENASTYTSNAEALEAALDGLSAEIAAEMKSVSNQPYIVFHDAYQYFEKRFGLTPAGSITVNPEVAPGADRVKRLREKILELETVCVFAEPQFKPAIVKTVIEGTNSRSGVIDPLGTGITDGPELYPQLIRNMSASLKGCLTQNG
ncbi:MAG: zinc ABC transporter substrate-binding protein [Pseudomonadota bacterium]